MNPRVLTGLALAGAVGSFVACGGSGSSSTPTQPTNPVSTTTITITASGTNPKNIQVPVGSQVTFVNSDSRVHEMTSDPHPEHTDCTELNQVGLLSPGQQRQSGNLVRLRNCGYHDHSNPGTASLTGTITIQ